jgi:peroxiredoxin
MKKPILSFFVSLFLVSTIAFSGNDDGYSIKVTIKNLPEGTRCQLCYYYGEKQYIKDSAKANKKGEVIFEGKEKLDQGVYLFVPGNQTYFDFLVDGPQHFTLETDSARKDYINKMKVKGSTENELFFGYQRFMLKKQKDAEPLREQYKTITKDNKDSLKLIQDKLAAMGEEVKTFQKDLIKNNPTSFVTKFLKAMEEPEIPEAPLLANGKKDSTFAYRYYKAHYFDNFDLADDRMLRTPIFHSFIKKYIDNLTVPLPDSINASLDVMIDKAKPNKEMFKYLVWYFTYTYETSKYMGMDAVFVHLVDRYYKTNQTDWLDSTQMAKIITASDGYKRVLIGRQAPSINMKDSTGKYIPLYDLKAKYTVVVFWDHGCGHCKKAMPILSEQYKTKLKDMGVEVYAIETENQPEEWKKFIREHEFNWINVHETDDYYRAFAKQSYNINSTPMIFVLDEQKVIKAKKVDPEQIVNIVEMLEKEKEQKAKTK